MIRTRLTEDQINILWDHFRSHVKPKDGRFFKWWNIQTDESIFIYGSVVKSPPRVYVRTEDYETFVQFKLTWL
jgi:hypothetical protein